VESEEDQPMKENEKEWTRKQRENHE